MNVVACDKRHDRSVAAAAAAAAARGLLISVHHCSQFSHISTNERQVSGTTVTLRYGLTQVLVTSSAAP